MKRLSLNYASFRQDTTGDKPINCVSQSEIQVKYPQNPDCKKPHWFRNLQVLIILLFTAFQTGTSQNLKHLWDTPPDESKSWVIWHWVKGAVSKEGITADLKAMKENGIAGAYILTIKDIPPEGPLIEPVVEQLSPLWWEMIGFAFNEADRIGMKLGFHICDGFALAGGPWITPELSMQRVVWSKTSMKGGRKINVKLPQPESYQGYYNEIAVFAYPALEGEGISTETVIPIVTNSLNSNAQFLADKHNNDSIFRSDEPCWIQFEFEQPFTCRTLQVQSTQRNLQGQRLTIESGNDGIHFQKVTQLEPPRQGWQNDDLPMTYSIPATTARYFRFLYDPAGTEPGSEDLDAAKWKQNLRLKQIRMSSEARIHQYEAKNASTWRVAPRTTDEQIPANLCIDPQKMIDISQYVDKGGNLNWKMPKGNWTILRIGHTSSGHTNATGGKGAGLECDKFNPKAIQLQLDSWFGKAVEVVGEELASRVLKVFFIDSWECGSQNWSSVFRDEFKRRRGYDIYDYLPAMAGIPISSPEMTEDILYDVRQTISELVVDTFYTTLQREAHAKGCVFNAENVAPTMMSDGMMHYKHTDVPMGEYWFNSPTHDKLNDVLDAVSGGRIYGKNIIQAEAFTQIRLTFDEHPEKAKTLQDRNYALGINRLSYHVYVLNPWLDRKPGMTLDGIGFYFQRDQTWWKHGKAWIEYAQRCHALLQYGKPVVDLAVFTGEEFPRRAILPERLVPFLPGIFGKEKVEQEKIRQANVGLPTTVRPVGVTHSAYITDADGWVNALRGYAYDSFNADALLNLATVENGRIVLPGGMSYSALVIPGKHPMQPEPNRISQEVKDKLQTFMKQGVPILMNEIPFSLPPGFSQMPEDIVVHTTCLNPKSIDKNEINSAERQTYIPLPYTDETFDKIGIERDFIVTEKVSTDPAKYANDIAYTHRQGDGIDIYFVSNQQGKARNLEVSLRASGRIPEIWNPVNGEISTDVTWKISGNRTIITLSTDALESLFIVLQTPTNQTSNEARTPKKDTTTTINTPWTVNFDKEMRGPEEAVVFEKLTDWTENSDDRIRYYSGTADYNNTFNINKETGTRYFLSIDSVYNMAEVFINEKSCGVIWTKPYQIEITDAIESGENTVKISVANTWANRIMGDEDFGAEKDDSKKIWTNARFRMAEKKLVKSGLTGEVKINSIKY
ncbi:MAG: DNA-binding protein [Tannerella sp.]|nr:DNA-binding protein [Tannerella sp.]